MVFVLIQTLLLSFHCAHEGAFTQKIKIIKKYIFTTKISRNINFLKLANYGYFYLFDILL